MNRSFSRQGRDIARPWHQMESGTYVQSGAAKPGQLTDGGVGSSPGPNPKTSCTRRLYAGSATGRSVCVRPGHACSRVIKQEIAVTYEISVLEIPAVYGVGRTTQCTRSMRERGGVAVWVETRHPLDSCAAPGERLFCYVTPRKEKKNKVVFGSPNQHMLGLLLEKVGSPRQ
jgi:hypothetical protein